MLKVFVRINTTGIISTVEIFHKDNTKQKDLNVLLKISDSNYQDLPGFAGFLLPKC